MKESVLKNKKYIVGVIALIHTLLTFISDKGIFIFPASDASGYPAAVFDYVVCKVLCLLLLYVIYSYIWDMAMPGRSQTLAWKITMSALPYLIVIVAVAAIKLPQGYLSNDEYSIYNDAVNLTHGTWFNIMTAYYYTVSLMALPFKYAPIIFKMLIEFFAVGYVTFRSREYFGNRVGLLSYLLFLLYPVIAYTTSAHRLPIYFLIYLVLFTKMIFDGLEGKSIDLKSLALMLLTGAVLTQWRTEGIYLAVLVPILMLLTYKNILRDKKLLISGAVMAVAFQMIVAYPQNAFSGAALDDAANDRMKPFYAYTITNMYRNGLDLEKNKEDLEIVDKYLSLDVLEAINEHYGDINYEDVLILYQEGFMGVREEATVEDFVNYSDALKRIFKNNPDVFIKTRIGAFCYAALPYHIDFSNGGARGLISGCISIVKSLAYNLFIPFGVAIVLLIYSLIKRRWFDFFAAGGLLCHWFIVFILAPASYFKYYFPLYIMAYFYVILGVMGLVATKSKHSVEMHE